MCKCGCVNRVDYIFDNEIVKNDNVSWNTIIRGFAMHGHGDKALDLFAQMKPQGSPLMLSTITLLHFELLH
jgi:pentatricopeptide repeat protein